MDPTSIFLVIYYFCVQYFHRHTRDCASVGKTKNKKQNKQKQKTNKQTNKTKQQQQQKHQIKLTRRFPANTHKLAYLIGMR